MNYRAYAAELVGTFLLAFIVHMGVGAQFPVPTPIMAGLTVGLLVYIFGAISGAHLNPVVTIALASVNKIKPKDAAIYIVVQCIGGFIAYTLGSAILTEGLQVTVENTTMVAALELLGAAILMLGISSVVYGKVSDAASGLTIGTALTLGVFAASVGSNGVLNPAVAIAIGSLSPAYILGPIAGAILGTWTYRALAR